MINEYIFFFYKQIDVSEQMFPEQIAALAAQKARQKKKRVIYSLCTFTGSR